MFLKPNRYNEGNPNLFSVKKKSRTNSTFLNNRFQRKQFPQQQQVRFVKQTFQIVKEKHAFVDIATNDAPTPGVSDIVTVVFSCSIPSTGFICRLRCMYLYKA